MSFNRIPSVDVSTIENLSWVTAVRDTERSGADVRVETDLSLVRYDHEIHDLQNLGCSIESISGVPDHGMAVNVATSCNEVAATSDSHSESDDIKL